MEKVLKNAGNSLIVVLFVVTILSSTIFMGLSERRLSNVSPENVIVEK